MALSALGLKSSTHCAAGPPTAAIFSRGTNALEVLISRTVASTPAAIHNATFMGFLLPRPQRIRRSLPRLPFPR